MDSTSQFKKTVILGRSRKNASIEMMSPAAPSTAAKMAVTSETIWMPFIVDRDYITRHVIPYAPNLPKREAPSVSPRISRNITFSERLPLSLGSCSRSKISRQLRVAPGCQSHSQLASQFATNGNAGTPGLVTPNRGTIHRAYGVFIGTGATGRGRVACEDQATPQAERKAFRPWLKVTPDCPEPQVTGSGDLQERAKLD